MNQLSPIDAHEQIISRIFSDDYAFEIPPYQRPYAWEIEHARDLLNDLLDAMEDTAASGGAYFLGSIVLIKTPAAPLAKVIDGQQRLTTLTMLLSVLRDLTSDLELKFERKAYIYQKASADKGTTDRYRLLLREQDRPFFLKYVQMSTDALPPLDGLEGSQLRIVENTYFFRSELAGRSEEIRNRLAAFIIQRCYLVVVAVPTAQAARRIFTVLNARGLDLTPTDILKADLLDREGPNQERELARRWEEVEKSLGRDSFVALFGLIRMIHERDKPRLALETAFKALVPAFADSAAVFLSDILEPIADAYTLLLDSAEIGRLFGAEAAKAVRSLQRIDSKDWMAPALLRIWKRTDADNKEVAAFLVDLERVAYSLFVIRADVNERIARFASIMDQYEPRLGKAATTKGLDLTPGEQRRFIDELDGPLYLKTRVCKPVMQRLDEALSAGGAVYDEHVISIEHVLPQTIDPKSEWAQIYKDAKMKDLWTHRLANLVFLTRRINTRASNWAFERKKNEYFRSKDGDSPFPLTQRVLAVEKWTPQALHERQQELIDRLCLVWRLDRDCAVS